MSQTLKITLFISLSWHLLFFSVFEPTFAVKSRILGPERTAFLGSILQRRDFFKALVKMENSGRRIVNIKTVYPKKEGDFFSPSIKDTLKPYVSLNVTREKLTFVPQNSSRFVYKPKEKPTLIFYPPLPYSFLIYFKDRQTAHMEFTFYISDTGKITFVKRRVSSGNLDTDLLAYRYITHCLFLQEGRFPRKTWQTVKIDLTRKEND